MSALDIETITELLKEKEPKSKPQAGKKSKNEPTVHEGPLGVLLQSTYCMMCKRPRSNEMPGPNITAMYTVNGTPLCTSHAMYVLSCICMENGYEVQIEQELESVNGSRNLPGEL